MNRIRLGVTLIAAATTGVLMLSTTPASAAKSDGWVRGYDTYVGDWGDEGDLGRELETGGSYSASNAVCLWQRVLWAEGARKTHLAQTPKFAATDVTGTFDMDTYWATVDLQKRWGLTPDGWAGKNTFGRADDELAKTGGSTARGETLHLRYEGRDHNLSLRRNTEGKYLFPDKDLTWRQAGYDYLTCD
ncbi:peptidoglycan-binding domain-containing protein [Streptomyces sp. NPDC004539]|uniref:peptidoglycan-binding domain-containing protein n=1 Tax=Streptomyces sp. NPDC004539 TaxID=3154280 RepID=UPI0033A42187